MRSVERPEMPAEEETGGICEVPRRRGARDRSKRGNGRGGEKAGGGRRERRAEAKRAQRY